MLATRKYIVFKGAMYDRIKAICDSGIMVMSHLGLTMQSPQYGVLSRSFMQTEGVGVSPARDLLSVLMIRKRAAAMDSHIANREPEIR
jgi:hypothetical protein